MKTKPCVVGVFLVAELVPAQAAQFGDFRYTSSGTAVAITGYTGSGGAVAIPDTIAGLPVTGMGDRAFSGYAGLTSITIPDSVTNLGGAFWGCTGLTNVVIGKRVTTISGGTFAGCTGLTSVMIPSTVRTIKTGGFSGCPSLSAVYFGGDRPSGDNVNRPLFECPATICLYYRPETSGWSLPVWGVLTKPWVAPRIQWQPGHMLFHANKPATVDMGLSAIPPAACQ